MKNLRRHLRCRESALGLLGVLLILEDRSNVCISDLTDEMERPLEDYLWHRAALSDLVFVRFVLAHVPRLGFFHGMALSQLHVFGRHSRKRLIVFVQCYNLFFG